MSQYPTTEIAIAILDIKESLTALTELKLVDQDTIIKIEKEVCEALRIPSATWQNECYHCAGNGRVIKLYAKFHEEPYTDCDECKGRGYL